MAIFDVIRKYDGVTVYQYSADAPIEFVDWPISEFDYVEQPGEGE